MQKAAKKSRVIIFLIYDSFYLLTKLRHSSVGCTRKALKNLTYLIFLMIRVHGIIYCSV